MTDYYSLDEDDMTERYKDLFNKYRKHINSFLDSVLPDPTRGCDNTTRNLRCGREISFNQWDKSFCSQTCKNDWESKRIDEETLKE